MPIQDSEIIWRRAQLVSDATPAQNGGRMSPAQIVSGVKNNLFPDVSQAERTSGSVKWRKAFIHVASAQDTALLNTKVFLDALTPAGDFVLFQPGTHTDTQDAITGRPYGIGTLAAALSSGATQVQVVCEHPSYDTLQPFRVGDTIRISDRPATGGTGNEEFVTISAVSYSGGVATIDFSPALANAYATSNTVVSTVYPAGDVIASVSGIAVSSASGTLDATNGNLVAPNRSAIADTFTVTFTSATAFSASGVVSGILGNGSITADFSPLNSAFGGPYFTLKAAAWGGTWQAGDSVTFTTTPAAIPVWYRREVPAGTASTANDFCSLAVLGESA